jgi:DNA-binding response OmpR family regulator
VLVVEDEEPIAETVAIVIEDAGFTPLIATNGKEALDLLHDQWPSLVITDLMMPYVDGATLIAQLRIEAERRGELPPPIVLMTAAGPKRARAAQADIILNKPFDLDEIERVLHQFLDSQNSRGA